MKCNKLNEFKKKEGKKLHQALFMFSLSKKK